jgi:VanZ family protein
MDIVAVKRKNIRFLPFLCITVSVILLLAGLWPFDFFPKNNVRWLPDQEALRFGRYGIATSPELIAVPGETLDFRISILFGLKIRPLGEPGNSIPRILSICDDHFRELFFVGQWKNHLIIRLADVQGPSSGSYRETGVDNLFRKNEPLMLEIHSDNSGLHIFADGRLVLSEAGYSLSHLSRLQTQALFLLGNSPTGESPWEGDLLGLFIHQDTGRTQNPQGDVIAFTQLGNGSGAFLQTEGKAPFTFFIPSTYRPIMRTVLIPPWKEAPRKRSFWKDLIINILGFIPFGFFFHAWLRESAKGRGFSTVLFVVLLGAGISLTIELSQVFLPTRCSSLTDVVSNTLGTYFGVLLSQHLLEVTATRHVPWIKYS